MPGGRPALFADRDGTVIVERDYLADPEGVDLIPGAARGLRLLADAGYAVILVSNQSGIARGLVTESQFRAVEARVLERLAEAGVAVAGSYHCPHHPDFTGPCECRKPGAGMFLEAARDFGLDLSASVYIGDRVRDLEPGLARGGRAFLVRTGYGAEEADRAPSGVTVVEDLEAAARAMLGAAPDR